MWSLFLAVFAILEISKAEDLPIGKLVAVDNPNVKRNVKNKDRNQVFASRGASFLKKNGDLFKIHRPGLLGKEKTVSFESVKFPGFFLRQKNKRVHLDNLKSRFILKDATFLESKDPVGETFQLFMHHDQFLCHQPTQGFNLVIVKDSPKRDTLNCAFNIVPAKSSEGKPQVKAEAKGSLVNEASSPTEGVNAKGAAAKSPIAKGKDAIKNHPDTPKGKPTAAGTSGKEHGKTGAKIDEAQKKQDKANTLTKQGTPVVSKTQTKAAAPKGKAAAQKGQAKNDLPNVPIQSMKELVNDLKGNKDPFKKKKTDSLIIVGGKSKHHIANNSNTVKNQLAPNKINSKPSQAAKQALPLVNKQAIAKAAYLKKKMALHNAAVRAYKVRQLAPNYPTYFQNYQNMNQLGMQGFVGQPFGPLNQAWNQFPDQARNHWVLSNPTKKVLISNPQWQAKAKTLLDKNRFMAAFNKPVNPLARQNVEHVFNPTTAQFVTPALVQPQLQYVPPQQWNQITSLQQSQINAGITPIQTQHVLTQETHPVLAHPPVHDDLTLVSTDNLLSKLHPELSLDHNANHDVNDLNSVVTSPSGHVTHHEVLTDHTTTVAVSPNVGLATSGIVSEPIHAASVVAMTSQPTLPNVGHIDHYHIGNMQNVPASTEPSITTGPAHTVQISSSTLEHTPDINQPPIHQYLNAETGNSLVHSHPDVTLQEAFDKMNPFPVHPIEITSEPIHNYADPIHVVGEPTDISGKAMHMRTHYVTSKPLDMNADDTDGVMKEVHVIHHNHHLVHAANEGEKEKFVSTLMDVQKDLCISLVFVNQLASRYRLVSTLNPHGYRPKGARFSLKTIFKVPKKRKVMSFKAYDERDPHRIVLLNGHKELNIYPVVCSQKPVEVVVDSPADSSAGVTVTGGKRDTLKAPAPSGPKPVPSSCPASCANECGHECPMSCCSDDSSSLLH